MAEQRKAATMSLKGNEYAKVAERMKLFREDNARGKHESAYEVEVDGTLVFTVWLWKDKTELMELIKSGVTDTAVLRASADANGHAKSSLETTKEKDFEKIETNALGRALANAGYMASGEIASFEEMEDYEAFKKQQRDEAIAAAVDSLKTAKNLDELKTLFIATKLMQEVEVIAAKDEMKGKLSADT